MNFIKRENIRWDIVKKTRIKTLLGWPFISNYSQCSVTKNDLWFRKFRHYDATALRIKLPWSKENCNGLRPSITVFWAGWFWFWRTD